MAQQGRTVANGGGVYVQAGFGGVDLLVTDVETEAGRDVAVHSPARGDIHVLQDRGKKLVSTTATILFVDQPGKANFQTRFDKFRKLADDPDAVDVFSHPLIGNYYARIADFTFKAGEGTGTISCTAKFLAVDEPEPVQRLGAGTTSTAGLEAVTAAAGIATTTAGAADLGLQLPGALGLIADALAAAADWASGDEVDSQAVFAQVATISGRIDGAINDFELTTDLSRWQLFRAFVGLKFQVVRAAESATSSAAHVIDVYVAVPRPLIAISAELYGAAAAPSQADAIAKLNRVRTPGLIPAGTTLKCPSDGARA